MKSLKKIICLALGGILIAALGSLLLMAGGWNALGPSGVARIGGLLTIMPFFWAGEICPPFFHIMDYLSKLPPPSGSVLIYFILPAIAWTIALSLFYGIYSLAKNQFKKLKTSGNKTGE
ncbi:MAG: hypothetical protein A2017_10080 [Lentisphaerae bacterium GWF2_44_16]|nr:MAG: hypothetical protein A2017_10080 [Lentisphaerae bacterium GWF2_44_16]